MLLCLFMMKLPWSWRILLELCSCSFLNIVCQFCPDVPLFSISGHTMHFFHSVCVVAGGHPMIQVQTAIGDALQWTSLISCARWVLRWHRCGEEVCHCWNTWADRWVFPRQIQEAHCNISLTHEGHCWACRGPLRVEWWSKGPQPRSMRLNM